MTMTPRQRWLALLEGKQADRIPTDYQAIDEVTARLLKDLGCNDEKSLWRKLHIDCRKFVDPVWLSFPKNSSEGNEVCQGVVRKLARDGMNERGS